jgi:hypothetical protein
MTRNSFVTAIVGERPKHFYRRCAYCGRPCYGLTCRNHRDLLDLDGNYAEARTQTDHSRPAS